MPGVILLAVAGLWVFLQAVAGELPARLLSWRQPAPSELASKTATVTRTATVTGRTATIKGAPGGWLWPIHGAVSRGFIPGEHYGIDIIAAEGTPIPASRGGVVTYAGWNDGYGNWVEIDHGDGWSSGYAHQSRIAVAKGSTVTAGQVIGYVGNTGNSHGAHLHFETMHGGTKLDPVSVIGGAP